MSKRLGGAIVLALVVAAAILAAQDVVEHALNLGFDIGHLTFKFPIGVAIGYLFMSVVAFLVAHISAKGYLKNGLPIVLLLGGGALAFGLSTLFCGLAVQFVGPGNVPATIYNTGLILAGTLHTLSAVLSVVKRGTSTIAQQPGRIMVASLYLGVLVFMAILVIATLQKATPSFFIPGVGPTMLVIWVLVITAILFAIPSFVFMRMYLGSKTDVLYWYSLSMALIALGQSSSLLIPAVTDTPIQWIGRLAYYLGAVYLLVSVRATVRGVRTEEGA